MKPATAKAKGRETENAFVAFLQKNGVVNAERRRLSGSLDKGDIAGWVSPQKDWSVCVEVKSGGKLAVSEWLKELEAEMCNSQADTGFVAVRPKGKPDVQDWFAVLPVPVLMDLFGKAGFLPTY